VAPEDEACNSEKWGVEASILEHAIDVRLGERERIDVTVSGTSEKNSKG